jgi:hypothetical protein
VGRGAPGKLPVRGDEILMEKSRHSCAARPVGLVVAPQCRWCDRSAARDGAGLGRSPCVHEAAIGFRRSPPPGDRRRRFQEWWGYAFTVPITGPRDPAMPLRRLSLQVSARQTARASGCPGSGSSRPRHGRRSVRRSSRALRGASTTGGTGQG